MGIFAAALFAAAMAGVVITDFSQRRIANAMILGLLVAYLPLAFLSGITVAQMGWSLLTGLAVFAAGFGCFAAGWVGGGDVKLAAVSALWLGPAAVPAYLLISALAGAVLALALMAIMAMRRMKAPGNMTAADPSGDRRILPYGPALACGAVLCLAHSPWLA